MAAIRSEVTDRRRERLRALRPPWRLPGLTALQTTRQGGCGVPPYASLNLAPHVGETPDSTARNWSAVAAELAWGRGEVATVEQVHGDRIVRAAVGGHRADTRADAIVSVAPGVAVGVFTADCLPVLYVATDGRGRPRGVAAAHCGWRGAAAGLAAATVRELTHATRAGIGDVYVWIGAGIAGASYEVGPEVAERFDVAFRERGPGDRWRLYLARALRSDLERAGVPDERIAECGHDTFTEPELLFSYRREGARSGRMLSLVGWRESAGG